MVKGMAAISNSDTKPLCVLQTSDRQPQHSCHPAQSDTFLAQSLWARRPFHRAQCCSVHLSHILRVINKDAWVPSSEESAECTLCCRPAAHSDHWREPFHPFSLNRNQDKHSVSCFGWSAPFIRQQLLQSSGRVSCVVMHGWRAGLTGFIIPDKPAALWFSLCDHMKCSKQVLLLELGSDLQTEAINLTASLTRGSLFSYIETEPAQWKVQLAKVSLHQGWVKN